MTDTKDFRGSYVVVGAENLRKAIAFVKDNRVPDYCPPHVVHPKYKDWELCDWFDAVELVQCANLCGFAVAMRPRGDA